MTTANWKTDEVANVYLTALCVWREARGESDDAIQGVLNVIRNRVRRPKWWGTSWVSVVLHPKQFTSFNPGDPNATKFPDEGDQIFRKILDFTEKAIIGQTEDSTNGAVLYCNADDFPEWRAKSIQVAAIGPFLFFREA